MDQPYYHHLYWLNMHCFVSGGGINPSTLSHLGAVITPEQVSEIHVLYRQQWNDPAVGDVSRCHAAVTFNFTFASSGEIEGGDVYLWILPGWRKHTSSAGANGCFTMTNWARQRLVIIAHGRATFVWYDILVLYLRGMLSHPLSLSLL